MGEMLPRPAKASDIGRILRYFFFLRTIVAATAAPPRTGAEATTIIRMVAVLSFLLLPFPPSPSVVAGLVVAGLVVVVCT